MKIFIKCAFLVAIVILLLYPPDVFASLKPADPSGSGVLDQLLGRFQTASFGWRDKFAYHAEWLFWLLVTINFVWVFGQLALQQADIAAVFRELIKFTITVGFFWWVLENGPEMAISLYRSFAQIASEASGHTGNITPSGVINIAFDMFARVWNGTKTWNPIDVILIGAVGLILLVLLSLVAINLLILSISAYIFAYAGFFFVAFGGSVWTRDMAVNFLKTALGLAVQIMSYVLIIAICQGFVNHITTQVKDWTNMGELGVVLIVVLMTFMLTSRIPPMLSGLVTGASVGNQGMGNFGAGAAVGAAAAIGGAAMAASKVGASNLGGAASAVKAAFNEAQQHMQTGTGMFAGAAGAGIGSSGGGLSSFSSAMKTAATFAADMGSNLGKGIASTAKEAAMEKLDQTKDSMKSSAMGKIASEIMSPGDAKQARIDNKDIVAAETKQASAERKEKAEEARAFLSGVYGDSSISAPSSEASAQQPLNEEVADFVNKSAGENIND